MGSGLDHKDKRAAHMSRRRSHGLTYQELGDEFQKAKSTAHSIINTKKKGKKMPRSTKNVGIPQKAAKKSSKVDSAKVTIKPKKQKKKDVMRHGYVSQGSAS